MNKEEVSFTLSYGYSGYFGTGFTLTTPANDTLEAILTRDQYRRKQVTDICTAFNSSEITAHSYAFDGLGRATNAVRSVQPLSMASTNVYAYNARSEVIGAAIETNDYSYIYDSIGNQLYTSLNAVTNAYTVNNLNQYKAITNLLDLTVYRLLHDSDGNTSRISDHSLYFDAENRLSSYMFGLNADATGTVRNVYAYDHLARRVNKTQQERRADDPGGMTPPTYWWQTNNVTTFVYDGWNLVHEVNSLTNGTTQEVSYFWGKDLSGSMQGAGGVGGLLAASIDGDFYFPCYDNNGNITAYIDEGGTVIAYRQFDAFGNTIAKGGDMVDAFHFWFSTKYLDHDTGLYYYGYRYYSPMLQRWINRDPIEERGGVNLYGFVKNDGVNKAEYLGKFMIAPVNESPSGSYADAKNKTGVADIYASVFIVLSAKDLERIPNGGMLVHGKRVTINLRDKEGKSVVNDTQAVTKRISIDSTGFGRRGEVADDRKRWAPNQPSTHDFMLETMPLYFNLLTRKMENCVEGEILIKANWYLFNNKYGNTWDTGGDVLSGSLDGWPRHGSIGSVPGWPRIDNSYFAAGSYYVTIKISKSSPYFKGTPYANPLWKDPSLNRERVEGSDRNVGDYTTKW